MGLSYFNFPSGVVNSGLAAVPAGASIWYVNSAKGQDSNAKGLSPTAPFKTVAYAFSSGKPKSGDFVVVAPGHTETVSAAAALNLNIAGVTILGLGRHSARPTFTLDTVTSATIAFAAANVWMINCRIDGTGFDAIVKMLNVTAAGCGIQDCMIVQAGATNQAVNVVTLGAGGDNFSVVRCECDASGGAGAATFVVSAAAIARFTCVDSNIYGDFSTALFSSASTNHITNMFISRNRLRQSNGTAKNIFNFTTSSTGCISHNTCEGTTWASAADVASNSTSTSLRWFQNFGFDDGAGAVSGVLVPAAGTIA